MERKRLAAEQTDLWVLWPALMHTRTPSTASPQMATWQLLVQMDPFQSVNFWSI